MMDEHVCRSRAKFVYIPLMYFYWVPYSVQDHVDQDPRFEAAADPDNFEWLIYSLQTREKNADLDVAKWFLINVIRIRNLVLI